MKGRSIFHLHGLISFESEIVSIKFVNFWKVCPYSPIQSVTPCLMLMLAVCIARRLKSLQQRILWVVALLYNMEWCLLCFINALSCLSGTLSF